jgi:hypothetical protein
MSTSGGYSVGIVRLRTKGHGVFLFVYGLQYAVYQLPFNFNIFLKAIKEHVTADRLTLQLEGSFCSRSCPLSSGTQAMLTAGLCEG